ncbi:MAG: cytochrome c oxidase assembly protein, partial [Pseudomonadota bacterium]
MAGNVEATDLSSANKKVAIRVLTVVGAMVALAFASVPAYQAFCQVTGWGGTTQRVETYSDIIVDREVTIRFDGTVGMGLPWEFKPEQVSQNLKIGETGLAFFRATNRSDQPITGRANFN